MLGRTQKGALGKSRPHFARAGPGTRGVPVRPTWPAGNPRPLVPRELACCPEDWWARAWGPGPPASWGLREKRALTTDQNRWSPSGALEDPSRRQAQAQDAPSSQPMGERVQYLQGGAGARGGRACGRACGSVGVSARPVQARGLRTRPAGLCPPRPGAPDAPWPVPPQGQLLTGHLPELCDTDSAERRTGDQYKKGRKEGDLTEKPHSVKPSGVGGRGGRHMESARNLLEGKVHLGRWRSAWLPSAPPSALPGIGYVQSLPVDLAATDPGDRCLSWAPRDPSINGGQWIQGRLLYRLP